MANKIDWRHAFGGSGWAISPENRQRVLNAIADWNSDWHVEHTSLWITRVEDEDGDRIWDGEEDNPEEVDRYFSYEFKQWMDSKFNGGKKKVVVGKATILPLPVASPPSSSKGAVSSSSF